MIPIPQPPTPEHPPEPIPPPSPPPDPMPEPPPTDPIPPPIRACRRDAPVASNNYPPDGLRSTRPCSAPSTAEGGHYPNSLRALGALCLALTLTGAITGASQQTAFPQAARISAVRGYIKQTWRTLTRSARDLPKAAPDPKFRRAAGEPSPVYLAADESRTDTEQRLRAVLSAEELQRIELRTLPARADQVRDHGLLYVPYPYVVPGGRFNEMYGWDSYFIQLGLLRDGELELARNMTDNFLYEIEHYGMIRRTASGRSAPR